MDTLIDTTTQVQPGQDGQRPDMETSPVPNVTSQSRTGEVLTIPDAARVIGRSEKTIRRLMSRGLLPKIEEKTPPFRKLVNMAVLRTLIASESLETTGRRSSLDTPGPSTQPPGQVSSRVQAAREQGRGEPDRGGTQERLYAEIERLQSELKETRTQSRAEVEAKEQRILDLTDKLIASEKAAGKWEQAESYRSQIYGDYMDLQRKYVDATQRLALMEQGDPVHVTLPPEREVASAATRVIEVHDTMPPTAAVDTSPGRPAERTTAWTWAGRFLISVMLLLIGALAYEAWLAQTIR